MLDAWLVLRSDRLVQEALAQRREEMAGDAGQSTPFETKPRRSSAAEVSNVVFMHSIVGAKQSKA